MSDLTVCLESLNTKTRGRLNNSYMTVVLHFFFSDLFYDAGHYVIQEIPITGTRLREKDRPYLLCFID